MPEFIIAKLALLPSFPPIFPIIIMHSPTRICEFDCGATNTVTLLSFFNNYRLTFIGLFITGVLPVFAVYTPMNMV